MKDSRSDRPLLSIVTPVFNGGHVFEVCLRSLAQSSFDDWELIVVDDGSDDSSRDTAERYGAKVLRTAGRSGPGAARNLGARHSRGEYLLFLDADCEVHRETLSTVAGHLREEPSLDALFGSYDDAPAVETLVSKYKNLQHHFVHQSGREEASTFWAGCGVIRRRVFLDLEGFDIERYPRPSIEDIELGYRLRAAGHRIKLAKDVQVKHHKRWTLKSLVTTDVFDRGIPWTELLLTEKQVVKDLNLDNQGRGSVLAAVLLALSLGLAHLDWRFWGVALISMSVLFGLNFPIYRFFYEKGGVLFALGCILLHWFYHLYCAFAFLGGHLKVLINRVKAALGRLEGAAG